MKKILEIILTNIKGFFLNSFWQNLKVIIIVVFSLAINGLLWYIFKLKIRFNPIPFIFAAGLILLNLVLANYLWHREKISSFILLGTGLFAQILMLLFIRYLMLVF